MYYLVWCIRITLLDLSLTRLTWLNNGKLLVAKARNEKSPTPHPRHNIVFLPSLPVENLVIILMYLVHRGTTFRQTYLNIRSLLPEKVRVMALTATATVVTRNAVCRIIGMTTPSIISEIPNRPNIKYIVNSGSKNIEETFAPLVEEVKLKRASMDCVIVYCRLCIFFVFQVKTKG